MTRNDRIIPRVLPITQRSHESNAGRIVRSDGTFLFLLAEKAEASLTIRFFDALYDQLQRHFEKIPQK